jgi:hypothetical protein
MHGTYVHRTVLSFCPYAVNYFVVNIYLWQMAVNAEGNCSNLKLSRNRFVCDSVSIAASTFANEKSPERRFLTDCDCVMSLSGCDV